MGGGSRQHSGMNHLTRKLKGKDIGFSSMSEEIKIKIRPFYHENTYSPAERGQKVEVEYVQTFIAVS